MELYGPAHYCNDPILIKLMTPDRAANMFFTLKDKFPSYISSLSSQIIRMDGGEYVSLAGEFNGMKEVIFFPPLKSVNQKFTTGSFYYFIYYMFTLILFARSHRSNGP